MEADLVSFAQDRIATAYSEQVWAVALVGAMNVFIANHAKRLLRVFDRWALVLGDAVTSGLALLFIWSRHFIFMHYDRLAKEAVGPTAAGSLVTPDHVAPFLIDVAAWSGVLLYTLVVLGAVAVAIRILFADDRLMAE